MFQGQGSVENDGEIVTGRLRTNSPNGPIEWEEEITAGEFENDRDAVNEMESRVGYCAGFFPTEQMVGSDALGMAQSLYSQWMNPQTHPIADARLELLKARCAEGDETATDIMYALRRIAASKGEQIGFSFKKLKKWTKKKIKKIGKPLMAITAAVYPPAGAVMLAAGLASGAFKKKKKARKQMAALQTLATTPTAQLAESGIVKDPQTGEPAPIERIEYMQNQAVTALTNVQQAQSMMAAPEEGYPPESYPEEDYSPESYPEEYPQESVEGIFDALPGLYTRGATVAGEEDEEWEVAGEEGEEWEVAGLMDLFRKIGTGAKKAVKAVGRAVTSAPAQNIVQALPGVSPQIKAGVALLQGARGGNPSSVSKVKTIKELSSAGVPKAQEALRTLRTAQVLATRVEKEVVLQTNPTLRKIWIPFGATYQRGAIQAVM